MSAKITIRGENQTEKAFRLVKLGLLKLARQNRTTTRAIQSRWRTTRKVISDTSKAFRKVARAAISASRRMLSAFKFGFAGIQRIGMIATGGIIAGFAGIGKAVATSFKFEAAEMQFRTLLGSIDAAKERFSDLVKFSASTPFQLTEIIEASKTIENFGSGLLDNTKTLKLTGDAAAALGRDIQEVSFWYGRFYALTRGGQAAGEERRRLLELGILSAEAATELKNMADAGMSLEAQMAVLNREFLRFEGGMKNLAQTGTGLFSTLKDNWTIAVATFGKEFETLAKNRIQAGINVLQNLVASGHIKKWAESARDALLGLEGILIKTVGLIKSLGDSSLRVDVLKGMGQVIVAAFMDAATVAARVLMAYAPRIGELIAKGIAAGPKTAILRDRAAHNEAIRDLERGGVKRWEMTREQIKGRKSEILQQMIKDESNIDIGSFDFSQRTKKALRELDALIAPSVAGVKDRLMSISRPLAESNARSMTSKETTSLVDLKKAIENPTGFASPIDALSSNIKTLIAVNKDLIASAAKTKTQKDIFAEDPLAGLDGPAITPSRLQPKPPKPLESGNIFTMPEWERQLELGARLSGLRDITMPRLRENTTRLEAVNMGRLRRAEDFREMSKREVKGVLGSANNPMYVKQSEELL